MFCHCVTSPTTGACFSVYYLPPGAEGRGQEIIKLLPYVHVCVRPYILSLHFCINLNFLFSYNDIFTKFAGNVYGYKKTICKILAPF